MIKSLIKLKFCVLYVFTKKLNFNIITVESIHYTYIVIVGYVRLYTRLPFYLIKKYIQYMYLLCVHNTNSMNNKKNTLNKFVDYKKKLYFNVY